MEVTVQADPEWNVVGSAMASHFAPRRGCMVLAEDWDTAGGQPVEHAHRNVASIDQDRWNLQAWRQSLLCWPLRRLPFRCRVRAHSHHWMAVSVQTKRS